VEVTVKVEALMVARFIALLNVAVITAVLGQTRVEASGGVTDVTVGGVDGSPGFVGVPAVFVLALHPARTAAERNAAIQRFRTFNVSISFSSSPSHGVPRL
jgi:hypothetical protein